MLYITEKSSQVADLLKALKAVNLDVGVEIIPLAGHILELYDFKDYDKNVDGDWGGLIHNKLIPFFPKSLEKKIKPNGSFMANGKKLVSNYKEKFNAIKAAIIKHKEIVLATDPDNEGATLGLEVIERCGGLNKVIGMVNMSKLDLDSLSREVKNIKTLDYMSMYACGDARAYFDQMFGINLTMMATCYLGKGKLLQVGGVKLPTLRMVVERDLAFEAHTEVAFFTLKGIARFDGKEFEITATTEDCEDGKFNTEELAEDVKQSLLGKKIRVDSFKETKSSEAPPKPYSLTGLQSDCNKKLKMSADDTLKIGQKLYADDKIESYPRVDSNYYSDGEFKLASGILKKLSGVGEFKKIINLIEDLSNLKKRNIFNDAKLEGHPHTALAPTEGFCKEIYAKLDESCLNVFRLVAVRYIIQFLNDYKFLKIEGSAKSGGTFVKFNESIGIDAGWKSFSDSFKMSTVRTIPKLGIGDDIEILSLSVNKEFTKPKPRFTEATLLLAMEKIYRFYTDKTIKEQLGESGIGTPATRAEILKQMKHAKEGDEPYFKTKEGFLISSAKGRDLIKDLPEYVSSPILRANMESFLKKIMKKEITKENYYLEVKKIVSEISDNISQLGSLLPVKTRIEVIKTNLVCPLCESQIVDSGKVFKCTKNLFKNGKQTGCKFAILKFQKPLKANFTEGLVGRLLAGEILAAPNGNKIQIDLKSSFFTKITYIEGADMLAGKSDELIETPKSFRLGNKFCFKNCFGDTLTKAEAKKLLEGAEIEIKRVSKAGKKYNVTVWVEDDGKFGSSMG